jgi:hypothetical protein
MYTQATDILERANCKEEGAEEIFEKAKLATKALRVREEQFQKEKESWGIEKMNIAKRNLKISAESEVCMYLWTLHMSI